MPAKLAVQDFPVDRYRFNSPFTGDAAQGKIAHADAGRFFKNNLGRFFNQLFPAENAKHGGHTALFHDDGHAPDVVDAGIEEAAEDVLHILRIHIIDVSFHLPKCFHLLTSCD